MRNFRSGCPGLSHKGGFSIFCALPCSQPSLAPRRQPREGLEVEVGVVVAACSPKVLTPALGDHFLLMRTFGDEHGVAAVRLCWCRSWLHTQLVIMDVTRRSRASPGPTLLPWI